MLHPQYYIDYAARALLRAWPVRHTIDGRPMVLNLVTAERWSSGPVDRDALEAWKALRDL